MPFRASKINSKLFYNICRIINQFDVRNFLKSLVKTETSGYNYLYKLIKGVNYMSIRFHRKIGWKNAYLNISKSGISSSFKIGDLTFNSRGRITYNTPIKGLSVYKKFKPVETEYKEKCNNEIKYTYEESKSYVPDYERRDHLVDNSRDKEAMGGVKYLIGIVAIASILLALI